MCVDTVLLLCMLMFKQRYQSLSEFAGNNNHPIVRQDRYEHIFQPGVTLNFGHELLSRNVWWCTQLYSVSQRPIRESLLLCSYQRCFFTE